MFFVLVFFFFFDFVFSMFFVLFLFFHFPFFCFLALLFIFFILVFFLALLFTFFVCTNQPTNQSFRVCKVNLATLKFAKTKNNSKILFFRLVLFIPEWYH